MSDQPKNRQGLRKPPPPKPGEHRSPRTEIKPGQVLNPNGAPRKGMSIAETIRTIQQLTPADLRLILKAGGGTGKSGLEQSLASMPQGVPMRILLHASAMIQSTCEPQPGILNYLADREEGKVTDKLEATIHESPVEILKKIDAANAQRTDKG